MTLQQLEYVIALSEHGQFVKAAEACGVTQSTLSTMIRKLEEELDVVIFDRNSHPIQLTLVGESIVRQARMVQFHAKQLEEMTRSERQKAVGKVKIGITPTIAPYIIPKLFRYIKGYPDVEMLASEESHDKIVSRLKTAELDMGIFSLPIQDEDLLMIPLYKEKFLAYVSPKDPLYKEEVIQTLELPCERLWSLKREIRFIPETPEPINPQDEHRSSYEAGNVPTLLNIVNENEGFTVIPELHIPMIRAEHRANLRPLVNPVPFRTVSLYVRKDYVREKLLNIIVDGIKTIVPNKMIDAHLLQYPVRL